LAAVVVFALGGVTGSSAQSACAADAKTVETAVAAFQANNPSTTPITRANLATTSTSLVVGGPYLRSWPNNLPHYFIGIADTVGAASNEVDIDPTPGTLTVAPAANAGTVTPWVNFDTETSSTGWISPPTPVRSY
jgi:hypothetical protein